MKVTSILAIAFSVFISVNGGENSEENKKEGLVEFEPSDAKAPPEYVKAKLIHSGRLDENITLPSISSDGSKEILATAGSQNIRIKERIPNLYPLTQLSNSKESEEIIDIISNLRENIPHASPSQKGGKRGSIGENVIVYKVPIPSQQVRTGIINTKNILENISINSKKLNSHNTEVLRQNIPGMNVTKIIINNLAKGNNKPSVISNILPRNTKLTNPILPQPVNKIKKKSSRDDLVITKIGKLSDLKKLLLSSPQNILANAPKTSVPLPIQPHSPYKISADDIMNLLRQNQKPQKTENLPQIIFRQLNQQKLPEKTSKTQPEKDKAESAPQVVVKPQQIQTNQYQQTLQKDKTESAPQAVVKPQQIQANQYLHILKKYKTESAPQVVVKPQQIQTNQYQQTLQKDKTESAPQAVVKPQQIQANQYLQILKKYKTESAPQVVVKPQQIQTNQYQQTLQKDKTESAPQAVVKPQQIQTYQYQQTLQKDKELNQLKTKKQKLSNANIQQKETAGLQLLQLGKEYNKREQGQFDIINSFLLKREKSRDTGSVIPHTTNKNSLLNEKVILHTVNPATLLYKSDSGDLQPQLRQGKSKKNVNTKTFFIPGQHAQLPPAPSQHCKATTATKYIPETVFVTETKTKFITPIPNAPSQNYLDHSTTFVRFQTITERVTQTITERVFDHKVIVQTLHAQPTACLTSHSTIAPTMHKKRSSYIDYYGDEPLPPVVQSSKSFGGMYLQWLKSRPGYDGGFYINQYGVPQNSDDLSKEMGRRWPRDFVIDERLWWRK